VREEKQTLGSTNKHSLLLETYPQPHHPSFLPKHKSTYKHTHISYNQDIGFRKMERNLDISTKIKSEKKFEKMNLRNQLEN